MDSIIYISLGVFVAVICLLVFIRSKTGNKYKVKNSDMVMGLLPIVLILLVSGKIGSFEFGDLKVKAALVEASNKEISMQVSLIEGIPVRNLESANKGSVSQIPGLIRNKTEALEFRLGHGGYYGPVIKRHFDALNGQSLLKYVIIKNEDNTFFGMCDAGSLLSYFENTESGFTTRDFANWLNRSNKERLSNLPGFIPSEGALMQNANMSAALSAMEAKALDMLPVVNQERHLRTIKIDSQPYSGCYQAIRL